MRKLIVVFLMSFLFMEGQAFAVSATLPRELAEAAPKAAEMIEKNGSDGLGLLDAAEELVRDGVREAKSYIFSGLRGVSVIMVAVVLLGVLESLDPKGVASRYSTVIGTLWITAVSAGDMNTLIGLGRDTIIRVSELSKLLLPALAAATAASGGVTAATVRQVSTVFFSDLLLTLIERLLLPMLYLYIGTSACAAVLEGGALKSIGDLMRKAITWMLSGLLILFTTYLTISGSIAGAADAQAVRLAKSAVSAAVPVVGGILAEAAETVLAGAGVMRGMIGAFGALAVVSVCLLPFLRLGVQYLLYQGAGFVAQASGPKKLATLLQMLGDAFALILGMVAASALLMVISLISMLMVVTA